METFSQIIVVDGYSKDRTREICAEFTNEIYPDENSGFFGAYNIGYKHSTGDFVMFIDSDAYLDNFDLGKIWEIFSDKNVGMIVCLAQVPIVNSLSKLMNDVWLWRNGTVWKYTHEPRLSWIDQFYARFFTKNQLGSGYTSTGPCYILRKSAIDQMGGMNPKADDFVLRRLMNKLGLQMRFYVSQQVMHQCRPSVIKLLREYAIFGLKGSQTSKGFFSNYDRLEGMLMITLSVATAPFIARFSRDPRHLVLIPVIRFVQEMGFIMGTLFLKEIMSLESSH